MTAALLIGAGSGILMGVIGIYRDWSTLKTVLAAIATAFVGGIILFLVHAI